MTVYAGIFILDYIVDIFQNENVSVMPVMVWFFISWTILCGFLYFLKIDFFEFSFQAFLIGWIITLIAKLVCLVTGFYSISLVSKNYSGLYWEEEIYYVDREPEKTVHKTFIFDKYDPQINREIDRIIEEFDFEPYEEKFIFWQTGYFKGYNPEHILNGKTLSSMDFGVVLGIYPLIECMSQALKYFLFLIWIPIMLLYFKGYQYDFKLQ